MGPINSSTALPVEARGTPTQAQSRPTPPVQDARAIEHVKQVAAQTDADISESVRQAVQEANEAVRRISTGVEFSLDEDTGRIVVRVINLETDEVLRTIPSEEMLEIARAMDHLQGLVIRQKA